MTKEFMTGDFENIHDIQNELRTEPEQPESKYEAFLEAPYKKFKEILPKMLQPGQKIIDIGSSLGNIESYIDNLGIDCDITCIDIDQEALNKLKSKEFHHVKTLVVNSEANAFIDNLPNEEKADLVILNATLHEINTPEDQRNYLTIMLAKLRDHLTENGRVIIGDYYYPDELSDEEVNEYIDFQARTINHADARNKFVKPDLLKEVASEVGFDIEDLGEDTEIRAVKQIDRRYYVVSLKSRPE